jgi:hypothetical protein
MDFNTDKYFVENSALTEAEKIQFAKDLLELERQGVLEYRDGRWALATGVEIEETHAGPVARVGKSDSTTNSTSSGEPRSAKGLPAATEAARPAADGASSPDSIHTDDTE